MMGGRSWDDWIEEYAESHQHPVNCLTTSFGIPMIALSILMVRVLLFCQQFWMIALGLFVIGWVLQFIGHHFRQAAGVFKDWRFLLSACGGGSRKLSA